MQQPNPIITALKKIWPAIYRIVNGLLYFLLHLFKIIVQRSIDQIRGM